MVEFCFETVNWSPYLGFADPDLPGMVNAAAAAGYRWISFDLPSLSYYSAHRGTLEGLRALMEAQGVGMLAIHSLAISDDQGRTDTLTREAVAIGHILGARYLHAGVVVAPDPNVAQITAQAEKICHAAGMEIAIEFLPFLPLASIRQTRDLLDAAGLSGRNFVLDTWHFFNGPDDPHSDGWAALESIPPSRIAYVQFNDHGPLMSDDLLFETTQNRLMPGAGHFDLMQFARRLRARGFDGIVGPELLSSAVRTLPIDQTAKQLMDATRPYWCE